jgi:hypothetical protein
MDALAYLTSAWGHVTGHDDGAGAAWATIRIRPPGQRSA